MLRWRIWIVMGIAVSVGSLGGPRIAEAFLGASAADLVYTPVTPCRIIDTRMPLAGGPITPGVQRDFLVSGTTGFEAQGGTAGGCGVPEGATAAMLNFVAARPQGQGDLRAWPFGQAVPFASIVNYKMEAPALNLANGVVVGLCDPATSVCTFDVSVQADVSGTDLVADVFGFLQSTAPRGAVGTANTFLGVNAGNFTMTGVQNTAMGASALQSNTTGAENTATGRSALFSNTTGGGNTATGFEALFSNTTGVDNTATGANALASNSTGPLNTATGVEALFSNTTGPRNTATGFQALASNTTGSDNTATGVSALLFNSTGSFNTAIGKDALNGNITGTANTATGTNALLKNTSGGGNTAMGSRALESNTGGGSNTAVGFAALFANTTGPLNTAVGLGALQLNTTGGNNIAIGNNAGTNATTGSNNIYIGNPGVAAEGGAIRIGGTDQTRSFIAGIRGVTTGVADAVTVLIDSAGQLGTASSSRRAKEDIRDMGEASRGLLRLRPVVFRYRQPSADGSQPLQYGLIAEEVAGVFPKLVTYGSDGQPETVLYHVLPALLLNELQRQEADLAELRRAVSAQAAELEALQAALRRSVASSGE